MTELRCARLIHPVIATMAELTHRDPPTTAQTSSATAAQFSLSAEEFALAGLFDQLPDTRVELDPTITNPDNCTLLVVRTDAQERTVTAALQSAPTVAELELFGECADGWTYRITWQGCPRRLFQRFGDEDIMLQSVQGRDSRWRLCLLAADREKIATAHDIMDDLDCAAACRSISSFNGDDASRAELTDKQRKTLIEAFESGYYSIPQNTTADELADKLNISHQALSERLIVHARR